MTYNPDEIGNGNGLIYVGIPRERMYMPEFVDNRDTILANLATAGVGCGYYQAQGHRVDRNRDRICGEFLAHKDKPEWLLMLDSDMEHPADCGVRLASWKKPIVGALYFHRGQTHDPFVFMEAEPLKDKYGRYSPAWRPLSDEVYEFLLENNVPIRDGAITITKTVNPPLVECDAVATGCILIHRSVLEQMPAPWFEYRAGGNSEDLMFCKEAKAAGFPIYCDLSLICGHYSLVPMGQAQFRMKFQSQGLNNTTYSKRIAADWWSKFFKVSLEKAIEEIENGSASEVGKLWKKKFGDRKPTASQVDSFYKEKEVGKAYIMELLWWNFSPVFNTIRANLTSIRDMDVLELGSGIGTVALQLIIQNNNVLAVEPNKLLRKFIDLRWEQLLSNMGGKHGQLSIVDDSWKEKTPGESFDVVVAIDVIEHIPRDYLEEVMHNVWRVLKPTGRFIFHNNWHQQDLYPMHENNEDLFEQIAKKLHFIRIGPMELLKGS